MRLVRFFTTSEEGSRFEEIRIPIDQPFKDQFGNTYHLSNAFSSPSVRLVELPQGLDQDWHGAPARQLVFVLAGVIEVVSTDNESRRWKAGEAFIADDVKGKGHLTRVLEGPAHVAFVQLPETFDVGKWTA